MRQAFVFNIQKYSLHDGDGIRTTIFFKGCPLSCQWCHNPEGLTPDPQIAVYPDRCRHCGQCASVCAVGSAGTGAGVGIHTDGDYLRACDACDACGACADACVHKARVIAGKSYSPDELIRIAEKDAAFYAVSGGGVTLSGGEVMVQPLDYLLPLVRGLKRKGLDLTIDTCGYAPYEAFEAVLPYTDLFLYDIKLIDSDRHLHFTGQDNHLILDNLQKLAGQGAKLQVRVPVIEGVNAHDGEMDRIVHYLAENVRSADIVLLPYHATGLDKYRRIGYTDARSGDASFSAPDAPRLYAITEKFRQAGFTAVRTGG